MSSIRSDGHFVFESLPPDGEVQLIALCDGYISKDPLGNPDARIFRQSRNPQKFDLTGAVCRATIVMEPAAQCQVHVLDTKGKPLAGAKVESK